MGSTPAFFFNYYVGVESYFRLHLDVEKIRNVSSSRFSVLLLRKLAQDDVAIIFVSSSSSCHHPFPQ